MSDWAQIAVNYLVLGDGTYYAESNGNVHTGKHNGVQKIQATDSTDTGMYIGIGMASYKVASGYQAANNWSGGDL